MAAKETGWYRTEGGTIYEMDHPLPEPIAQRVARGEIVRVAGPDGAPFVAPDQPPPRDEVAELRTELAAARARVEELTAERDALAAQVAALTTPDQPAVTEPEQPTTPPAKATKATKAAAKE